MKIANADSSFEKARLNHPGRLWWVSACSLLYDDSHREGAPFFGIRVAVIMRETIARFMVLGSTSFVHLSADIAVFSAEFLLDKTIGRAECRISEIYQTANPSS